MVNLAVPLVVFGPLAGPECRRALARGWLIAVRSLAAMAISGALLVTLWAWWMNQAVDPEFSPYAVLRIGLGIVEGMMVTIALVMAPAVLAGSIAGEKERGVMALLLTTRVDPREIIAGRLTGKLAQVAMILLAGFPAVVALATLAGLNPGPMAALLALPMAVAAGGGGLSMLASTVSRRGRDALLTVYLLDVLFLLTPMGAAMGWTAGKVAWLGAINPFVCLDDLVRDEDPASSLVSMALWVSVGLVAAGLAAWRLRPASLRPIDGDRLLGRGRRRGKVPPFIDERPMLWKELFIERVGALGGLGWWLGAILVVLMGAGSLILGGLIAWSVIAEADPTPYRDFMKVTIGSSALFVGWLIQWAVGLRAAVAISSERERGTWDALLTSPLEGTEIVRAKLWGSLHALRWLLAATLLAWTVAACCGAIGRIAYAGEVTSTGVIAAFMAAVGVRASLSSATATRAMTIAIGVWLGAHVVVAVLSAIVLVLTFVLTLATTALASGSGWTFNFPRWFPLIITWGWPITTNAIYVVATLMLVADTRLRFDRLAGRMTAGRVATALDSVLHGRPRNPWRRKGKDAASPSLPIP